MAALAAVVGPELREETGLRHLAADRPARLGGVVEHERGGRPAHPLEDPSEPVARALGPLAARRDAVAGVGVGQRGDRQPHVGADPGEHAAEAPEVHLRRAGRPLRLQEALRRGLAPPPPGRDASADGRVGARVAALGDEPVVDPPGGVPPLPGAPRSASGTESIQAACGPTAASGLSLGTGGAGDMPPPTSAYFATVLRLTPRLLAIRALGTPGASITRTSRLVSGGTVILPLLLRAPSRQSPRPGKCRRGRAPCAWGRGPANANAAHLSVPTMLKSRCESGAVLIAHQQRVHVPHEAALPPAPVSDLTLRA